MRITLNGEERETAATRLSDLADEVGLGHTRGIAIAVDGTVVPRSRWPDRPLAAGAVVTVIRATQGG